MIPRAKQGADQGQASCMSMILRTQLAAITDHSYCATEQRSPEQRGLPDGRTTPRRVISRDELLNEVWGYEKYPCTRTVDNHILKLRKKLETEPAHPKHFHTVHSCGYKFLS